MLIRFFIFTISYCFNLNLRFFPRLYGQDVQMAAIDKMVQSTVRGGRRNELYD